MDIIFISLVFFAVLNLKLITMSKNGIGDRSAAGGKRQWKCVTLDSRALRSITFGFSEGRRLY
jgi:hypothetical protein